MQLYINRLEMIYSNETFDNLYPPGAWYYTIRQK
jgi:hypothetical protein